MLEHTMFKGTKNLGTLDEERDQALQKKIESLSEGGPESSGSKGPQKKLPDGARAFRQAEAGVMVIWDASAGQVVCRASFGQVALTGLAVTMEEAAVAAWLDTGLKPWLSAKGMPSEGFEAFPLSYRDRDLGALVLSG